MTNLTKDCPYENKWLNGFGFSTVENLKMNPHLFDDSVRLCYSGTSSSRVYLIYEGEFKFVPYIFKSNTWQEVYAHKLNLPEVPDTVFDEERNLFTFLMFALEKQFPHSVEAYWDDCLNRKSVMSMLNDSTTVEDLTAMGLSFIYVSVQKDDEWDGAVGVNCDEGIIVIPFCNYEDAPKALLVEYATFHPDNWFSYLVSLAEGAISTVASKLSIFSWSNFRRRVDGR